MNETQEVTTRGDGGWRRFGSLEEFRKVSAKVVPDRVEIRVGELRVVSDPSAIGRVRIFLDGQEALNSQDAVLRMPLDGPPILEIEFVLGLKKGDQGGSDAVAQEEGR